MGGAVSLIERFAVIMIIRYEFWVDTRPAGSDEDFKQLTENLRSGSELAAKHRLEGLVEALNSDIEFQGVVEEGRYIPDPDEPTEIIFELSGRTWLLASGGDTLGWIEDFVSEDVQSWAVR